MKVLNYFIRHSIVRVLTFSIGVLAAFMVTPHVLRSLGDNSYGIWSLIVGLVPYYLLVDFGQYQAVAKKSAAAGAHKSRAEIQEIFSTSTAIAFSGSLLVLGAAAFISFFVELFFAAGASLYAIRASIMIFSLAIAWQIFLRPSFGILAGAMHWTMLAVFSALRTVATSLAAVFFLTDALPPDVNLMRMAVISALGFAGECTAMLLVVHIKKYARFSFKNVSRTRARELLAFGLPSSGTQIGEIMKNRTQIYIVGLLLGSVQVTLYSLSRQFVCYMQDLMAAVFGILSPYFSKLQALGGTSDCRGPLLDSLRLSFTTSCLIGLGIIFYGDLFMTRWLGPGFSDAHSILIPLAIAMTISSGENPAQGFIMGLGKHQLLFFYSVSQGLLVTASCFFAAWLWGVTGVAWAVCAITVLYSFCFIPRYTSRVGEFSAMEYYRAALGVLSFQGVAQLIYFFCIRRFLSAEYVVIFLFALGQALVCALVFYAQMILISRRKKSPVPSVTQADR